MNLDTISVILLIVMGIIVATVVIAMIVWESKNREGD